MPKPSKRMAAKQAELSKRKKRDRPLASELDAQGAGAAVAEPSIPPAEAAAEAIEAMPLAPVSPPAPQQPRPAQGPFRQPAFRAASRTGPGPREGQTVVGRPLPKNPYQARDLRSIVIVSGLLVVLLVALKFVL